MLTPEEGRRLLRWYPPAWRDRYGHELLALVEDTVGDGPVPARLRASLVRAGFAERARATGLGATGLGTEERARSGERLLLCAAAAMAFIGAATAKSSERWPTRVDAAHRHLAMLAQDLAAAAGGVAVLAVAIGALALVPSWWRQVRRDGWSRTGHALRTPVGAVAVLAAATLGLVGWANHLDEAARNGGSFAYSAVVVVWGLGIGLALVLAVRAALALERGLVPDRRTARRVAGAATVAAGAMLVAAAASLTWLVAVGAVATGGGPVLWVLAAAGEVGVAALALVGASRLGRPRLAR